MSLEQIIIVVETILIMIGGGDDFNFVRFTAFTSDNQIRVHRFDVLSKKIEVL